MSGEVLSAGPPPDRARAVLVLLHGRGGSARDILSLHADLALPELCSLAPQAPGHTWYPQSFLAPLAANRPALDRSLATVARLVDPLPRVCLLGFSQGACLSLEFVARNPRRYGAVLGLTGGLIGPPGGLLPHAGNLQGTPVFLGSGDPDPHVPFERVQLTAEVLTGMGAQVELRRYRGRPHTVSADEIEACRTLLRQVLAEETPP